MTYLLLLFSWFFWAPAPEVAPNLAAVQARLHAVSPKTVVVLLDVSGSMEKSDTLVNAREATIKLLRDGVVPGDRVVIMAFDNAPHRVADRPIRSDADLQGVIDSLPGLVTQSQGTNIRWAHHDVLKLLEQRHPEHSDIIVVTDSFNDPPARDDPHMKQYLQYYDPHSLTHYPDTPQNRDYERLLRERRQLHVDTLGIGVEIDEDTGRPKEQWPKATPVSAPAPPEQEPRNEPAPASFNPLWLIAGLVAAVLALLAALFLRPLLGAEEITLVEGARQAGPFRMRSGSVVEIGGATHGGAFGVPIPGTSAPVAYLRRGGAAYRLELAPLPERDPPEVRVNDQKVQKTHPLRFMDEIQVRLPRPEGARVARYSFERYTGPVAGREI